MLKKSFLALSLALLCCACQPFLLFSEKSGEIQQDLFPQITNANFISAKKFPPISKDCIRIEGLFLAPQNDRESQNGYLGFTWDAENKFGMENSPNAAWFYADIVKTTGVVKKMQAYAYLEGRYTQICSSKKGEGKIINGKLEIISNGKMKWGASNQGYKEGYGKCKFQIFIDENTLNSPDGQKFPFEYKIYTDFWGGTLDPLNDYSQSFGVAIIER